MAGNKIVREEILKVVDNQIRMDSPPETKLTFDRLIKMGYSKLEVKQLIGQCILLEMYTVLKEQKPFNESRYIKTLQELPRKPAETTN